MQKAVFADPFFLVDDDAVHDGDLTGRAAERQGRDPQPDAQRLAEGNTMRRTGPDARRSGEFGHAGSAHACAGGVQLWVSRWQSRHQAYNASYITIPCSSIAWSSGKLAESPSDSASRPGDCGVSSRRAVSAPLTIKASASSAGSSIA